MISYQEALRILSEVASRTIIGEMEIPLAEAAGRVLSRDVNSPESVPPFHNSAMDGYALCSEQTSGISPDHPALFRVRAFVAAGDEPLQVQNFQPNETVEIMTGGMLPAGNFNSIVKLEEVERIERDGYSEIQVKRPVPPLENIRLLGSDFQAGCLVAQKGTVLQPEHLMALAGAGVETVWARKLIRIALISTGKELLASGEKRQTAAQIRNSSAPYLAALLRSLGCGVLDLGILKDEPGSFEQALRRASQEGVDLILSTGAVSVGKHDFVIEVLERLKATIHFHKAAIRPGKPICFAELKGGCLFFGLPGNPVSTAVGVRFFVEPLLRARLGLLCEEGATAVLTVALKKPASFRCFFKGIAELKPGGLRVKALREQGSYLTNGMLQANCWIELPEGAGAMEAGREVKVFALTPTRRRGVFL